MDTYTNYEIVITLVTKIGLTTSLKSPEQVEKMLAADKIASCVITF